MKDLPCDSYCEHGGVCELDEGHVGPHDSSYCQWTDSEAVSKEVADGLFREKAGPIAGPVIALTDTLESMIRANAAVRTKGGQE